MTNTRFWGFGVALASLTAPAWAQDGTDVYEILQRDVAYVHPSAKNLVNVDQIRATAEKIKPVTLKVIIVPSLGSKWRRGGQERRGSFGEYVLSKRLSLSNAIVITYTKSGITAYSDRVGDATLAKLNNQAVGKTVKGDFTPAIVWLADAIANEKASVDTKRTIGFGGIALVGGGAAAIIIGGAVAAKAARLAAAKAKAQKSRERALEAISYLDSYVDLLPAGEHQTAVRDYRERAFTAYESGRVILEKAKTPEELAGGERAFETSFQEATYGKQHIQAATDGTTIAFTVPPKLDPTAPPPVVDDPRAPLYAPYDNVCFFTSRPGHGDLTPVQINLDGQRRTVMVSPEVLQEMQSGHMPEMRGRYVNNRFVPWYMVGGYDPYSMYGTRGWIWDMLAFNSLMNMFNPFGNSFMIHNYYGTGWGAGSYNSYDGGYNPNWDGSGGSGSLSDLDQSGEFGGFDFGGGGGGSDWGGGGGDWGGGDFGGGDFGGGDF